MQTILEGESGQHGTKARCDWCVSASYCHDDYLYCHLKHERIKRGSNACIAYIREIGADDDRKAI